MPIPDPKLERDRQRLKIPGELPSPLDPDARLRFMPSKLRSGNRDYVPELAEVSAGHWVAEHDDLQDILDNIQPSNA